MLIARLKLHPLTVFTDVGESIEPGLADTAATVDSREIELYSVNVAAVEKVGAPAETDVTAPGKFFQPVRQCSRHTPALVLGLIDHLGRHFAAKLLGHFLAQLLANRFGNISHPDGAFLDRVQLIKGWLDAKGETHEKVIDAKQIEIAPTDYFAVATQAIDDKTDLKEAITLARGTSASAIKVYADLTPRQVKAVTAAAH